MLRCYNLPSTVRRSPPIPASEDVEYHMKIQDGLLPAVYLRRNSFYPAPSFSTGLLV